MFGYHPPNYTPYINQPPEDPPTIPTRIIQQAKQAGATHLSKDGKRAYCTRMGAVFEAYADSGFGSWWGCEGLPKGAIEL